MRRVSGTAGPPAPARVGGPGRRNGARPGPPPAMTSDPPGRAAAKAWLRGWVTAGLSPMRHWLGPVGVRIRGLSDRVQAPVALRLPAAALAGVALAVVLTLAGVFWAGSRVGRQAALAAGDPRASALSGDEASDGLADAAMLERADLATLAAAGHTEGTDDAPGGAIDLPTTDPRIPGHNYLHLVSLRPADIDEARRIQRFFQRHGVATILTGSKLFDPTAGAKPSGWIQVVDVSRGFTRTEWFNGDHEAFYSTRRALGRAWKAHNRGVGSDLNTMMFRKFKDPDPD